MAILWDFIKNAVKSDKDCHKFSICWRKAAQLLPTGRRLSLKDENGFWKRETINALFEHMAHIMGAEFLFFGRLIQREELDIEFACYESWPLEVGQDFRNFWHENLQNLIKTFVTIFTKGTPLQITNYFNCQTLFQGTHHHACPFVPLRSVLIEKTPFFPTSSPNCLKFP